MLSIFISFSLHFFHCCCLSSIPQLRKKKRILHATLHLSLFPFSGVLCVLLIYNDLIYYLNVCPCYTAETYIFFPLFFYISVVKWYISRLNYPPPPQTHLKIFFLSSFLFGWFLRHKWFVLWHLFFRFFFFVFDHSTMITISNYSILYNYTVSVLYVHYIHVYLPVFDRRSPSTAMFDILRDESIERRKAK